MGPACPKCGAVYEWTAVEIEERYYAPKVHFCPVCHCMFVLSPEEVASLQTRLQEYQRELDEAQAWLDEADLELILEAAVSEVARPVLPQDVSDKTRQVIEMLGLMAFFRIEDQGPEA